MSDNKYTIENHVRIYDDKNGDFIQVKPDADGLGLVEISRSCDGKMENNICVSPEEALLLAKAIIQCVETNSVFVK